MKKPLEGIKMLDLTHMLSGPYGAMIIADLGADTVKVEPPKTGEGTRRLLEKDPNNSIDGMGAYFFTLNRNKRSVTLDLKSEEGLSQFYELVKVADVVMNNFSAGVTKKLKIDYETLSKVNPRIITCTVTGFGETGPACKRPAFDQIAQALGGGMSITGNNPEDVIRAGIPIGDLGGGMFAVMGILAAINARHTTGRGQHVDISMLDCQLSMMNYMATMHSMSGDIPGPLGNSHFVHVPYNTFKTKTDMIVIACVGDQFWPPLLDLLDDEELRDSRFEFAPSRLKEKAYIEERINNVLINERAGYWLEKLEDSRIPCARVNNVSQAMSDPQIIARNMVVDLKHPLKGSAQVPGNPIKLSETNEDSYSPPPLLGAHNDEVLKEWLNKD
ncbi:Acetyl-coenzyme A synthetase protein [Candidatus Micropelagos thuwalensis]|uniref:Acetyl-coenzyme A synthetase protein n=1 Tax=Candidatus Micropelagius thuwalensis TaxID=1397666 RepID=U2WS90_9PROT|nr:CoA transferase [Candidatus Micropelagos thuwalensis]ERL46408.1 Acetyl-coenzyme A synthetase protein [Candidatus Micropelagos thuwalensis]